MFCFRVTEFQILHIYVLILGNPFKESLQCTEVVGEAEESRGPSLSACVQNTPLMFSGLRHPAVNLDTHARAHVCTHTHITHMGVCACIHTRICVSMSIQRVEVDQLSNESYF